MPRLIKIKIKKRGAVEIKTEGFTGNACLSATAGLHKLLGGSGQITATEEMHQIEEAHETLRHEDGASGG